VNAYGATAGVENHARMQTTVSAAGETVILERGELRVELALRPFSLTLRRANRRLLRNASFWAADGTVNDQFIQLTEGVLTHEELAFAQRTVRAELTDQSAEGVELALALRGGRAARLRVTLPEAEQLLLELEADGEPLRLAAEWDRRPTARRCRGSFPAAATRSGRRRTATAPASRWIPSM
jgi:hypothetical protein